MDDIERGSMIARPTTIDRAEVGAVGKVPPGTPAASVHQSPTWRMVAYFATMFSCVFLGFSLFHGRSAIGSLAVAPIGAMLSLVPWWFYYRISGRNEGIAFWAIIIIGRVNTSGDKSTSIVLQSLLITTLFNLIIAIVMAKIQPANSKPPKSIKPSLWDVDFDGPR